ASTRAVARKRGQTRTRVRDSCTANAPTCTGGNGRVVRVYRPRVWGAASGRDRLALLVQRTETRILGCRRNPRRPPQRIVLPPEGGSVREGGRPGCLAGNGPPRGSLVRGALLPRGERNEPRGT